MSNPAVEAAFAALDPWITRFLIEGVPYGGWFDAVNDPRLTRFFECFPHVATILELGSLEGGHTIGLASRPGVRRVLGIEGRAANLERARLSKKLLHAEKAEFLQANLETTKLSSFGKFDAVFCSGLLYHLPQPWELLNQLTAVSPHLFLWTHYAREQDADISCSRYRGRKQREGGLDEPLSGLSPDSFWPTLGSLVNMLTDAGFGLVKILSNHLEHENGPAVTIAASIEDRNPEATTSAAQQGESV